MKPNDFLELAAKLIPLGTEAALRAAVGRAYYGAFHAAVLLIDEMGIVLPPGPESHAKVRYCLMESGEPLAQDAGKTLQILRTHRNAADYDLDASGDFSAPKVTKSIKSAQVTMERLQRCREADIGTRFRDKLRNYAANVLRLPVT